MIFAMMITGKGMKRDEGLKVVELPKFLVLVGSSE